MPDAEFDSLHLADAADRREAFRQARGLLRGACGDATLAGEAGFLDDHQTGGGATQVGVSPASGDYSLRLGAVRYPLAPGINTVGRMPGNAVVLPGEHISRRHCAVVIHHDGRAELHDIASKNGTLVNGKPLAGPTRLTPGDRVTVAGHALVFERGE